MDNHTPQGNFEYYQKWFLGDECFSFSGQNIDIEVQEYVRLDYTKVDHKVACDLFAKSIYAISKLLGYKGDG